MSALRQTIGASVLALSLPFVAAAQRTVTFQEQGVYHLSMEYSDHVVVNDYVFLAGGTLLVLDLSNPSTLDSVAALPDVNASAIAVEDSLAYISGGNFKVVNISTPISPVVIGSLAVAAADVIASGGYAYLATSSGLSIIDISNPSSPALVGNVETSSPNAKIAIAGDHAYLISESARHLNIIEIINPNSPQLISTYESDSLISAPVEGISVAGSSVLICYTGYQPTSFIEMVNVSDPLNLQMQTRHTMNNDTYAMDIFEIDRLVFVVDSSQNPEDSVGIEVVDITNPLSPSFAGRLILEPGGAGWGEAR